MQIDFDRVRKTGIIRVDGVDVAKDELGGRSKYLTTADPLYVGGLPSGYVAKGIEEVSQGSLLGCIKNVVLNGVPAGEPVSSVDVEPCTGIKEPGVFFGPTGGHVIIGMYEFWDCLFWGGGGGVAKRELVTLFSAKDSSMK